jgi:hypothetical protein
MSLALPFLSPLRILDAFVKACEIRGFEVRASEPSARNAETIVKVHREEPHVLSSTNRQRTRRTS